MLPSAKTYLYKGGLSHQAAAYATIGCFLGGVISIQLISRFLHHYIPSHVVDCDHSHEEHNLDVEEPHDTSRQESHHFDQQKRRISESTPLISPHNPPSSERLISDKRTTSSSGRNSRAAKRATRGNLSCGEGGPCYGYSDLCGPGCFEGISRSPTRNSARNSAFGRVHRPTVRRSQTAPYSGILHKPSKSSDEESLLQPPEPTGQSKISSHSIDRGRKGCSDDDSSCSMSERCSSDLENEQIPNHGCLSPSGANETIHSHHHHVPTNAFLAIGLQTSIAIALHKLPEGFITFATNHANPRLGIAVFLALFIHNITEGFAIALPLYLALGSRWKSMFWSSLLGGISQPLGAAVAALLFGVAGQGDMGPGEKVYGCMFAITAGVMASVALQLFSESLGLTHNRGMCIIFAFIGMGILGVSFALTAS